MPSFPEPAGPGRAPRLRHVQTTPRCDSVLKSGKRQLLTHDVPSRKPRAADRRRHGRLVADDLLEPPCSSDQSTPIGGLTMGADAAAFATWRARACDEGRTTPGPFSVRKDEKDLGAGGRVAGARAGDRVGITEDSR